MPYDKNQKYPEYKIYKLVCNDTDLFYVGSTRDFTTRKSKHKSDCNKPHSKAYNQKKYLTIRQFGGWENWNMVCIDILYDVTKLEAEIREEKMRMDLKALLNSHKASCGGITKQEYNKIYYEENRDHFKEQNKLYREENREQIRAQKNEKCDCDCGGKYNHDGKARHLRTKKHQLYLDTLGKSI